MTVPMIKSIGDVPYPIDTHSDAFSPLLTAGAALGITGNDAEESAWLARTSEADGVASVRSIHGNTIVQDGALVPVNMAGIESTGFNAWDEQWESGDIDATTGQNTVNANVWRSTNYIPVFPSTEYYVEGTAVSGSQGNVRARFYDADKGYIGPVDAGGHSPQVNMTFVTPANCHYMRFAPQLTNITDKQVCINLSNPTRNGTYEPYWHQTRSIPAGTLRSAGTVYDELTETERITRIREVDLGTLTWTYYEATDFMRANVSTYGLKSNANTNIITTAPCTSRYVEADGNYLRMVGTGYTDAAAFKTAMNGVMLQCELATYTVTPHDQPLNMTYRAAAGGTERVMVPTGELSAPPTIVAAQGYTAESLRDAALSCIAPVENGKASTNYGIGSYLVHGGQLCKVTTAIATGEAITIGTNVTATTVMAEVLSITQ